MSADVPQTVACPCGTGYAERKPETVTEPGVQNRTRTIHCYRHEGCPVGGHIVVEGEYILRRGGPLFRTLRSTAPTFTEPAVTLTPGRPEVPQ